MTIRLTVSAGGRLCPCAKNLIRAAALTKGVSVRFRYGEQPSAKAENGARYTSAQQLEESLRAVATDAALPEAALSALEDFTAWVGELPNTAGPELPPLREVLEETRRQSDFRTAGQRQPAWESFWALWKTSYAIPQVFEPTGKGTINEVNKSEAEDYLDAHLKTAGEVDYMRNAVDSLLAAIPEDVERILDIGSGPGYINSRLPADYSILAMDIDEEILRGNTRQTCLGDIMDIPLADRSVDLVMACDVVEHLPDEVLKKGAAELERVSNKYIYLQVPFQEDPLMAFARCPQCGNVWHVNHHKHTFDEKRLCAVLSDAWTPVLINYTGDVTYRRNGQTAVKMAQLLGWKLYGVSGCTCPNCGGESQSSARGELELMQRMADYDTASPFPVYSEIGILFCRADAAAAIPEPVTLDRYSREAGGVLPVGSDAVLQQVYTGTERLPALYLSGCRLAEAGDALRIERLPEAGTAWAAVAFPALKGQDAALELLGCLDAPGEVGVGLLDESGNERYMTTWNWDSRESVWRLPLPKGRSVRPVYIKLYFTSREFVLRGCRFQGGGKAVTLNYLHEKPAFLSFLDGGTEVRLYAPAGEGLRLSHKPADWRAATNDPGRRLKEAVRLYTEDLRAAVAGLPGGDNRYLIEEALSGGAERMYRVDKAREDRTVRFGAGKALEREVISAALYEEAVMDVYGESGQARFKKKVRKRIVRGLKWGKDRVYFWMHRHERLYEKLIDLGFKDAYQKIKRRILR